MKKILFGVSFLILIFALISCKSYKDREEMKYNNLSLAECDEIFDYVFSIIRKQYGDNGFYGAYYHHLKVADNTFTIEWSVDCSPVFEKYIKFSLDTKTDYYTMDILPDHNDFDYYVVATVHLASFTREEAYRKTSYGTSSWGPRLQNFGDFRRACEDGEKNPIQVEGIVTAIKEDGSFFMQSSNSLGYYVLKPWDYENLHVGDIILVSGYPKLNDGIYYVGKGAYYEPVTSFLQSYREMKYPVINYDYIGVFDIYQSSKINFVDCIMGDIIDGKYYFSIVCNDVTLDIKVYLDINTFNNDIQLEQIWQKGSHFKMYGILFTENNEYVVYLVNNSIEIIE